MIWFNQDHKFEDLENFAAFQAAISHHQSDDFDRRVERQQLTLFTNTMLNTKLYLFQRLSPKKLQLSVKSAVGRCQPKGMQAAL